MGNVTTVGELVSYLTETHDPDDPWILTPDGSIRSSKGKWCPIEMALLRLFGPRPDGYPWSICHAARHLLMPRDVELAISLAADNCGEEEWTSGCTLDRLSPFANARMALEVRSLLLSLCDLLPESLEE